MMLFSKISIILQAKNQHISSDSEIEHLLVDSRKLFLPENTLFIAIKGKNHDGHKFIEELYEKGVRNFIVENTRHLNKLVAQDINFVEVKDSVKALQKIVAHHRLQFDYPVIAITGSNGKTIVKEWLTQLLSEDFNIVKSPKSYNSQIGVPLSVWQMRPEHQLAIFEAGISQTKEMANLQSIIQPTVGIFTNLGTAHNEGFRDMEEKLAEKLILFQNCPILYLHEPIFLQYPKVIEKFRQKKPSTKVIYWSYSLSQQKASISFVKAHEKIVAKINPNLVQFQDEAYLQNLAICSIITHCHFKISLNETSKRIALLRPVSMRLELKQGLHQTYLIDDSYNNDLAGLQIALDFLVNQEQKSAKVVILSDILESDLAGKKLYMQVAKLIKSKNIGFFIGIGEKISQHKELFKDIPLRAFYQDTEDFLKKGFFEKFKNCVILVKGARKFTFEKIIQKLEYKAHRTVLEINLDALVHNLNFYRNRLRPSTKIMAMVKAFAYGSGSIEVANLLQFHRVSYLAVAYADEGVELRKNGIYLPIMVMNPAEESFAVLAQYQLEPAVYSFDILQKLIQFCKIEQMSSLKIHIEFDTGMRRLGFEERQIATLVELLKGNNFLKVSSVMSHLAAADEEQHDAFSLEQIKNFEKICTHFEKKIGYPFLKHILNSSGIVRFPEHQLDMVRLGIGLYGVEAGGKYQDQLQPISRLKTIISQIKHLKNGETIGYGRKGKAYSEMTIGIIAIGYADGLSRAFSNGVGKVKVRNKIVPIVGNICMDMAMIDLTEIPEAEIGDEVIIFDEQLTIQSLADAIGTIPYEILTNVSQRVKRVFYSE
ncbi:MAG: bifunctional UDP-N-acetylmuramoyl-tripeptide:D-alanyl-D-alanine ligase/alanine racemase [Raineya sp.]